MILYPATSLHRVNPVTRGVRLASFFWIQSMAKDDTRRTLLFDLDMAIDPADQRGDPEPSRGGGADELLSQPSPELVGDLTTALVRYAVRLTEYCVYA